MATFGPLQVLPFFRFIAIAPLARLPFRRFNNTRADTGFTVPPSSTVLATLTHLSFYHFSPYLICRFTIPRLRPYRFSRFTILAPYPFSRSALLPF